jgi:endogenous inhibitor of DNA gyrase (YacG/DUF329 family)
MTRKPAPPRGARAASGRAAEKAALDRLEPEPAASQPGKTGPAKTRPAPADPAAAAPTAPAFRARPCPICGALAVKAYRPFCSRRCADVDLHRWLAGSYAIPGAAAPAADEDD